MISAKKITKITSGVKKFSSKALFDAHWEASSTDQKLIKIKTWVGKEPVFKEVLKGILRMSFLIESVGKAKGGATKIRTRYSLEKNDPRYASYDECVSIYNCLLNGLQLNGDNLKALELFFNYSLLPYELPIDYLERKEPIHRKQNISWLFSKESRRLIELRAFLMNSSTNKAHKLFERILKDKIKTKVYLTDRVQTGDHQTNREKRWEVHPSSVHFATRNSCFAIETTLIEQLVHFKNFPQEVKKDLLEKKLIVPHGDVARCPIIFEELDFNEFKESIINPKHGHSNFQVGHLNPLKANPTDPKYGHTAKNIAWVSSHGNRLQGHLTIDEWNDLLKRIIENRTKLKF